MEFRNTNQKYRYSHQDEGSEERRWEMVEITGVGIYKRKKLGLKTSFISDDGMFDNVFFLIKTYFFSWSIAFSFFLDRLNGR